MNYQQHRNPPPPTHPQQQYGTPYHILEPPSNPHHLPLPHLERQPSARGTLLKLPFNPNGYSEVKEYFRPQQTVITTPLTFNMQSPSKLKAKKTNRPASKLANKSYASPFTQELEREFFKNQPNHPPSPLEDFSKTTSSVNGSSFLNLQQTYTEPNDQRIYTPHKLQPEPQPNKIGHSNSLKILFEYDPENKPYTSNLFNHSNSNYLQKSIEPSSANKQRENGYLLDQRFLLEEIKGLKEMNEKYQKEIMRLNVEIKGLKNNEGFHKEELRGSRKENKFESKQLELKLEQNNKLLAQIEDMEKDLKGKVDLNRYLEHQCNSYSDKYEEIKRQFENFKTKQGEEGSRQEQIITSLRKHQADLQNQANILRINDSNRECENIQLKKALQLQGQKLQELSTNNEIDKSQINVLTKRLENFQAKYEKLMHSHYETESKLHNYEETLKQSLIQRQQKEEQFARDLHGMQSKLKSATDEKELLCMQLSGLREEVIHLENRAAEMKMFYEEQYDITRQDLVETNKIVESKTQENQHLRLRVEARAKENEEMQNKLREILPTVEQLRIRTSEKVDLEGLLEQKSQEIQLLQVRQKSLQQDYIKISCQIEQRNTVLTAQTSQITQIKAKAATMVSLNAQMNTRYDSLRAIFESQSLHIKEMQSILVQHQCEYSTLQREFGEYTEKSTTLQKEYDELKQLYQAFQSLHEQTLHKVSIEAETLQSKDRELTDIIHKKQAQISDLEKVKLQAQIQLQQAKDNLSKMDEMRLLCSHYEQKLKDQSKQAQQSSKRIQQIQQKCTLIQSEYLQVLQENQSASQARQAQLASSCKSQVQTWDLVSKKELQIQSLLNKIQILEEKLQSKTDQLHAIAQMQTKQQSLKLEITELMLIVQENQKRSQEQKDQLGKTIVDLKVEMKSLQQQLTEEGLEYNSIIVELKASIEALQTEYSSLSASKSKMKTSIMQGEELQLKQWNSLSEFQSFDSLEEAHSRKIQSAEELPEQMGDVDYIEMDREGVNYLCQLLQIDAQGGNILSQIVVRVENALNQVELSRKTSQSYREVLEAFGVQEGAGSYGKLMAEITSFKQSLGLVIDQLKDQQQGAQALRGQCCQLRMMHQGELVKGQRLMQELHCLVHLNQELNEIVLSLNAKLTNQRFKMVEAMALAKLSLAEVSIPSEKFVTARSIGDSQQSEGCIMSKSDIE